MIPKEFEMFYCVIKAEMEGCDGISLIDKRHLPFLLQGNHISLLIETLISCLAGLIAIRPFHILFYFARKDKVIIYDCSMAGQTSLELSFVEHIEFRIIPCPEPPFKVWASLNASIKLIVPSRESYD